MTEEPTKGNKREFDVITVEWENDSLPLVLTDTSDDEPARYVVLTEAQLRAMVSAEVAEAVLASTNTAECTAAVTEEATNDAADEVTDAD